MYTIIQYRNRLDDGPEVTGMKDLDLAIRCFKNDVKQRPYLCQLQVQDGAMIRILAIFMKEQGGVNNVTSLLGAGGKDTSTSGSNDSKPVRPGELTGMEARSADDTVYAEGARKVEASEVRTQVG